MHIEKDRQLDLLCPTQGHAVLNVTAGAFVQASHWKAQRADVSRKVTAWRVQAEVLITKELLAHRGDNPQKPGDDKQLVKGKMS